MTFSGTPGAVVVEDPKLEVMSLPTIPLSASALGPFDPSPGKGPDVSSGIGASHAAAQRLQVEAEAAVVICDLGQTISMVVLGGHEVPICSKPGGRRD